MDAKSKRKKKDKKGDGDKKKKKEKKRTRRSRSVNEGESDSVSTAATTSVEDRIRRASAPQLSESGDFDAPERSVSWSRLPRHGVDEAAIQEPEPMSFSAPDDYLLGARPQVLKRKHERSHSESQRPRMNKKPSFLFFNKGTKKSTAVLEIDKALKRADRDASNMDLSNQGLDDMPDRLAQFTGLLDLDLSKNKLRHVSTRIVALTSLTKLNLSQNDIKELPREISALSRCRTLNLSSNRMRSMPALQLCHLSVLNLEFNLLEELPSFSGMSAITRLIVFVNRLKTLPDSLCELKNLTELDVGANILSALPTHLATLGSLTKLNASGNRLKEIPLEIAQISTLQTLDLRQNYIKPCPSLAGMGSLKKVSLGGNRISKLTTSWEGVSSLMTLSLEKNSIKVLPEALFDVETLRDLVVSNNRLKAVPAAIGRLVNLRTLDLSGNRNISSLPVEMCKLVQLRRLTLDRCSISAIEPEILADMADLESLSLSENAITELPIEVGNLRKLRTLNLNSNQLTSLPEELCQLPKLRTLMVSENQLAELPEPLGGLCGLLDLHANLNHLERVPDSLTELNKLERLLLSGNRLKQLPSNLRGLGRLKELLISDNAFEEFPEEIAELKGLEKLYCSNMGSIQALPSELSNLSRLKTLHCEENALLDGIPSSLFQCPKLEEVCLAIPHLADVYKDLEDASLSSVHSPAFKSLLVACDIEGPLGDMISKTIMEMYTALRHSADQDMGTPIVLQPNNLGVVLIDSTDPRVHARPHPSILEDSIDPHAKRGLPDLTGENYVLGVRWAEMKGLRTNNEDALCVAQTFTARDGVHLMGVFDGHGGSASAVYVAARLPILMSQYLQCRFAPEEAIRRSFSACHHELHNSGDESGTTAAIAFLLQNRLYIANAGDSRAVVMRDGEAVRLSFDHKPLDDDEHERVVDAGGFVSEDGRVMGDLMVSRALGDARAHPYVVCDPHISSTQLSMAYSFIIIACDGLWDLVQDQEACDVVSRCSMEHGAYALRNLAYARGSSDNITVMVVYLKGWDHRSSTSSP